jgi:DNA transformation protein and related proteins
MGNLMGKWSQRGACTMTDEPVPVEQLRNIGPTIARRLREIGIRTRDDLQAVGSAAAYRRICAAYPGTTIPVCYYLYSLEGALRDQHWDALGSQLKQELLRQVSPR